MSFDHLGLLPELLRAVADEGYTEPTPVQAEAIPLVLAGRDVLAGAQTGTGKTAAFVLPILQILHGTRPKPREQSFGNMRPRGSTGLPIRCLVLTPTRELALQIEQSVRTYGAQRPILTRSAYNSSSAAELLSLVSADPGGRWIAALSRTSGGWMLFLFPRGATTRRAARERMEEL